MEKKKLTKYDIIAIGLSAIIDGGCTLAFSLDGETYEDLGTPNSVEENRMLWDLRYIDSIITSSSTRILFELRGKTGELYEFDMKNLRYVSQANSLEFLRLKEIPMLIAQHQDQYYTIKPGAGKKKKKGSKKTKTHDIYKDEENEVMKVAPFVSTAQSKRVAELYFFDFERKTFCDLTEDSTPEELTFEVLSFVNLIRQTLPFDLTMPFWLKNGRWVRSPLTSQEYKLCTLRFAENCLKEILAEMHINPSNMSLFEMLEAICRVLSGSMPN